MTKTEDRRSLKASKSQSRSRSPAMTTKKWPPHGRKEPSEKDSSKRSMDISKPSKWHVEDSVASIDIETLRRVVLAASKKSLFDHVDHESCSHKTKSTIKVF